MQDGFLRAAAASIPVAVADPRRNAAAICARIDQAHRAHAALLVLPELCVTGYTCGGLFLSALLLDAAEEALMNICAHTQNCAPVVVLGVPLRAGGKLYNCAAVLHRGRILGVVPKTWLPNYDVFAEKRCFASAAAYSGPGCVPVGGQDVPFGTGLVFACAQMPAFRLGVELCEDVWAPVPPSVRLCLAGATVIANCSASPEAAGKPAHRRTLLRAASARGLCGYVYANAGPDESTAHAVFSAHHLIAENGTILVEHAPFAPESGLLMTELDLLTLTAERRRNTTFVPEGEGVRAVTFSMPLRPTPLGRACCACARRWACPCGRTPTTRGWRGRTRRSRSPRRTSRRCCWARPSARRMPTASTPPCRARSCAGSSRRRPSAPRNPCARSCAPRSPRRTPTAPASRAH